MDITNRKADLDRLVKWVGYFATPFALFLGLLAVLFTDADGWPKTIALGLLGFAGFFNVMFPRFLKDQAADKKGWNVKFRLYMNLVVNTVVIYLLGDEFPPLWLLLALTPFATAIYGERRRTLVNAVTAAVLLVAIQAIRPVGDWLGWAEVAAQAVFILLMSLMVNGVASLNVSSEPPAQ
jgi:hypothetical protein